MKFRIQSGELSLDCKGNDYHDAAIVALNIWHKAEEKIHLDGVLNVKELGPRGGILNEKMFSTASVLNEMDLPYIKTDGEIIMQTTTRPEITQCDEVAGSKWLALRRAHYNWPGEKSKVWEYVTRPTRQGKHDAVVIVPFLKDRLVVISEFRIPVNDYEIGFPAGLIDGDEDPVTAAKRELQEETGLTVERVLTVSPPLFTSAGLTNENVIMVFVECSGNPDSVYTDGEKIEVITLDLKGVTSLLENPPCSVSARLWPFLKMMQFQGFIGWRSNEG